MITPGENTTEEFTTEKSEDNLIGNIKALTSSENDKHLDDEFFINYKNAFKDLFKKPNLTTLKYAKRQRDIKHAEGRIGSATQEECFEKIFMENSMFLYSFLHSVVSLIINGTKTEKSNKLVKNQKIAKKPDNVVKTEKTNNNGNDNELKFEKCKLIVKILITWLVPILSIIALYFAIDQNMQIDLISEFFNTHGLDPNLVKIIEKPLNVSTTEKKEQVGEIIKNIYQIMNSTQENAAPVHFEVYQLNRIRKPKVLEECPNFNMLYRFYVLMVFVFYIVAISFMKIKETKIKSNDAKTARQLNISIISFASLWFLSILELFSKTYLFNSSRSNLVTEVFLTLGNLNQLSIIVMNCLTAKEMMKKYNLVEPKA
ncbi:hypothetical protein BDFB_000832 [Asbolus verrucosus]|uniref:Uncharacterized protein n=1 Tax=Asbolus verrucosus TaxID=1661398 RepID=A0A482V1A0_ASBVE|nr:hypothetical protein BDFB_000832 [Asbolus verrucosus]